MNVFDQIDKIFQTPDENTPPPWAMELLEEIKTLKSMIAQQNYHITTETKNHKAKTYLHFINDFRAKMRPNPQRGTYPEFSVNDKMLALDEEGYIYDRYTLKRLSYLDAQNVYKYLYNQQNNGKIPS